VWKHFSISQERAKCNVCNKIYTIDCSNLKRHLKNVYKLFNVEHNLKRKNDANHEIWQYFSKHDEFTFETFV